MITSLSSPNRFSITLLLFLFGISIGLGQPQPPAQRRPGSERLAGIAGGPGRFGPGYQRLLSILTEEQKNSLREAMEEERDKVAGLEQKLREATRDLHATGLTPKFDEGLVREKAAVVAKLEAEMTVLRFKAFSKMQPKLSSEQLAKLRELPGDGPDAGRIQGEFPRKRPEKARDENGLPKKD